MAGRGPIFQVVRSVHVSFSVDALDRLRSLDSCLNILVIFQTITMFKPIVIYLLMLTVCSGAQNKRRIVTKSFARGLVAEKYLLKGSTLLHDDSPRSVIYKRPGSRCTAYADFYALKPTDVVNCDKKGKTEILGKVGNHATLILTIEIDSWQDIEFTRFVSGKDPMYYFYVKVFWYMGDYLNDGYIET